MKSVPLQSAALKLSWILPDRLKAIQFQFQRPTPTWLTNLVRMIVEV